MDNSELARQISELLAARGWSQRFLEDKAALGTGYISALLSGSMKSQPKQRTLVKIAAAFGIPLNELSGQLDGQGDERPVVYDADLEGVDVNLLAIKEMDREEFELIARQLAERREKLERERKEFRRAERRRHASSKQARSTDTEEESALG